MEFGREAKDAQVLVHALGTSMLTAEALGSTRRDQRALAFYRAVGARFFVDRCETLLRGSKSA